MSIVNPSEFTPEQQVSRLAMIAELVDKYRNAEGCCSRIVIEQGRDFYWLHFHELEQLYSLHFPGRPIPHHELVYPVQETKNG